MKVTKLAIPGAFVVDLDQYGDSRGFFMETYQRRNYFECDIHAEFVQDNRSLSAKNVLRGLHYQIIQPQGHLVHVMRGSVFDVGLDIRRGSPAFGQWFGKVLSAEKPQQLYFPPGVAHGFFTLGDENEIYYKCTDYFCPGDEGGVLWNDPDIGIDWPVEAPMINERDAVFPRLKEIPASRLPKVDNS